MIELRLLGTLQLRAPRESQGRDALLTQPKRVALLSYLAAAQPGSFHRRDNLLGLFWPELDEEHARGALNQAIRYLRRSLGEASIVSRGQEEVGLDPERVWCDVAAFEQALEAGRLEEALDCYRGEFLTGFFVSDTPEFERWLEEVRSQLRERAAAAARELAQREAASSNQVAAASWARRAVELARFDEGAVCDAMRLLDRAGDRAGAILEFEKFSRRLGSELDLEPAPETWALAEAIRARAEPNSAVGRTRPPASGERPVRHASPLATDVGESGVAAAAADPSGRRRRTLAVASAMAGVVVAGAGLVAVLGRGPDLEPSRAVVMPFANRTGDASLDPLAYMAAERITQGLAWADIVQVVPTPHALHLLRGFREEGPPSDEASLARRLAGATGSGVIVTGSYYRHGEVLEFEAQLVDARNDELLHALAPARAPVANPIAAIDLLRRRTMGALAVQLDGQPMNRERWVPPPTYEAYQLWMEGNQFKGRAKRREAIERYLAAAEADSTFITPLVGAAIEHINLSEFAEADSVRRVISRSRARLAPVDRLLLRWVEAQLAADYEGALQAIRELTIVSPIFRPQIALDALAANRPREAIEVYEGFDLATRPAGIQLSTSRRLTDAYHRLGEHRLELREARRARRRHPDVLDPLVWEVRALAALRRAGEVQHRISELETLPPDPKWTAGEVMIEAADELHVHEQTRVSRAVLARALAWFQSRPEEASDQRHRSGYAAVLLRSDRPDAAEPVLRSLLAEFPDEPAYLASYGVLLARRGDRRGAEQVEGELLRMERPFDFGLYPFLRARIAAQLGDRERAIALLAQAVADGLVLGTTGPLVPPRAAGRPHLDPAFDALRADPAFQRLLLPKP